MHVAEPAGRARQAEKDLLHGVLGVGRRARSPQGEPVQIVGDQVPDGIVVAAGMPRLDAGAVNEHHVSDTATPGDARRRNRREIGVMRNQNRGCRIDRMMN